MVGRHADTDGRPDESAGRLADAQRNFLVCFNGGVAALLFAFTGTVNWPVALIVMAGSVSGGYVGAKLSRLIPNEWLRHVITAAGAIFTVYYFIEAYG